MAVISTIEKNETGQEIDYPCLMVGLNKAIVLFQKEGCGTVLEAGSSYLVSAYLTNWAMSSFVPFIGTITLKNGV